MQVLHKAYLLTLKLRFILVYQLSIMHQVIWEHLYMILQQSA